MKIGRREYRVGTIVFWGLACVCLLYGLVVMVANSGTKFFVFWLGLAALLYAAGRIHEHGSWNHFPAAVRMIGLAILLCGAALFLVTQILVLSHFFDRGSDTLDYIVVLGAQVHPSGPSVVLRYRLDAAADFLESHPETKVVVSGGQGSNEYDAEAHVMAAYLKEHGISEDRIFEEDRSTNTTENIINSSQYFDESVDSIGIVTNNFHLFRGLQLAKGQGYAHVSGIAASSTWVYLPNNMVRESLAIVKDYMAGHFG